LRENSEEIHQEKAKITDERQKITEARNFFSKENQNSKDKNQINLKF
jgi:hypothetical protein